MILKPIETYWNLRVEARFPVLQSSASIARRAEDMSDLGRFPELHRDGMFSATTTHHKDIHGAEQAETCGSSAVLGANWRRKKETPRALGKQMSVGSFLQYRIQSCAQSQTYIYSPNRWNRWLSFSAMGSRVDFEMPRASLFYFESQFNELV